MAALADMTSSAREVLDDTVDARFAAGLLLCTPSKGQAMQGRGFEMKSSKIAKSARRLGLLAVFETLGTELQVGPHAFAG